jgi:hypothetical protein
MGTNGCFDLINSYTEWLKQRISIKELNGVCEVTTPFLDHHNDCLQIYITKIDDKIRLSDDGYILTDLKLSGFDITTEKRKRVLNSILNGFSVCLQEDDELVVDAKSEDFPQKKHNLIQAMLAISNLFVTSRSMTANFFKEDVEKFLKIHDVRFTPTVKFTGKSGLIQSFDFVIPASKNKPERVLQTIGRPNLQKIRSLLFAWSDIKTSRPIESEAIGILDDTEQPINPDFEKAFKEYEIKPLLWSKREEYLPELLN